MPHSEFSPPEFSFRTRAQALEAFAQSSQPDKEFDLLVIGGGITGCGVAHDAATRGLRVALVEAKDFASGTSSKSSKLIHGGLRYLENMEFGLVFEALSERAFLLKTAPHLVKPLAFYMPVYAGDRRGRGILGLGMWLYDLLSLFRAPEFHKFLRQDRLLALFPSLRSEGLKGGFKYYDASMWDDVMTVEVARASHEAGASVANYLQVTAPIWKDGRLRGVRVKDMAPTQNLAPGVQIDERKQEIDVCAKQVIVCAGAWTDQVGELICSQPAGAPQGLTWSKWLTPSKGVHLVFSHRRIPVPGAIVMAHPTDGRIAFAIPRLDMGPGVTIVGTTDGPSPVDPAAASVEAEDTRYLMDLLQRYFPDLGLQDSDILSSYVGVRPLYNGTGGMAGAASSGGAALRKVSREHHIAEGPGGSVFVAGGKYTTYRRMAGEIVDFTIKHWKKAAQKGAPGLPTQMRGSQTSRGVNPLASKQEEARARGRADASNLKVPRELWERYGASAITLMEGEGGESRTGFPRLGAQLRFSVNHEMALTHDDFERRRSAVWAMGD